MFDVHIIEPVRDQDFNEFNDEFRRLVPENICDPGICKGDLSLCFNEEDRIWYRFTDSLSERLVNRFCRRHRHRLIWQAMFNVSISIASLHSLWPWSVFPTRQSVDEAFVSCSTLIE